jgi:hypothetical protein
MTDPDLSDMPSTDGAPATDAPVVAGAGETFDDLDSATPLSADGGPTQPGDRSADSSTGDAEDGSGS